MKKKQKGSEDDTSSIAFSDGTSPAGESVMELEKAKDPMKRKIKSLAENEKPSAEEIASEQEETEESPKKETEGETEDSEELRAVEHSDLLPEAEESSIETAFIKAEATEEYPVEQFADASDKSERLPVEGTYPPLEEDVSLGKKWDDASELEDPHADMTKEESEEVPPVKEIREKLSNFEMEVPVWGLTVFTADGYIIAHKLFYDAMPDEIGMAISSMSAGLITISEDFIRMVDSRSTFRQVLVDSEYNDDTPSFSILLKAIAENVLIACIFPSSTQLGLVTFEIENLCKEIRDIIELWDVKLHEDTVT